MAGKLDGKKIAFLFADGVEQVELEEPLKAVKSEGADVDLISLEEGKIQAFNHLDHGDEIEVDKAVSDADASDYDGPARSNAMSCVLRVGNTRVHALLPGDLERPQELRLAAQGVPLQSDWLLVPHHGSRTSSSDAFLDAVHPALAVAQAGYRNRFGHPAPDVVQRYADRSIEVIRSDRCGAWWWHADGTMTCEREVAARYWHHFREVR